VVGTRRLNQLAESVKEAADFPPPPFVVALSGGADSGACAWIAASLGPTRATHVHHGLAASDLMEAAAKAIAQTLGIELDVVNIEVVPWSEGRARDLRYGALLGGLKPDEWLLTGHTADDQAETVFSNLLRGTGIEGLKGIPARRPPIARPLLGIDRSKTRELATLAGLKWIEDPTNLDLGPLRNRLRLRLLPQLEAEYNLSFRQHLVDVASTLSTLESGPVVSSVVDEGEIRLPVPMLKAVDPEVAVRSIRAAVRSFRDGYSLTRAENQRVWKVVQGSLTSTELTGGVRVAISGPWLVFAFVSQPSGDGA
jgi:tRNA(Ile)-lysidine synthase